MRCVILIPPSEGKAPGGQFPPLKAVDPAVKVMIDRLRNYSGDFSLLLGVKDKALAAAVSSNKAILTAPTMPAIKRYSGVVYDGIDYVSMSKPVQSFFNDHVRIVSAVFGLLKPQDLIPDYKLKIEKLDAAKHWRSIIAKELEDFFVIDLLPQAHQKAVSYKSGINVDFIVTKNGKPIPAGHQGKLIKGKFVRWLCDRKVTEPKDFSSFKEDGFRFDGNNFIR